MRAVTRCFGTFHGVATPWKVPGRRVTGLLGAALAIPLLALTGCGGNRYSSYCDAVSGHQEQLTNTFSAGGKAALIDALPAFEDLRDRAPSDIRGDWDRIVTTLQGLRSALQAAGVDPASYDRKQLPAGVTAAQKAAIDAASRAVGSAAAAQSAQNVQQEARDVCHTPLTM